MPKRGTDGLKTTSQRGALTDWRTRHSRICVRVVAPNGEAPRQSAVLGLLPPASGRHTQLGRRVLSTAAAGSEASVPPLQKGRAILVRSSDLFRSGESLTFDSLYSLLLARANDVQLVALAVCFVQQAPARANIAESDLRATIAAGAGHPGDPSSASAPVWFESPRHPRSGSGFRVGRTATCGNCCGIDTGLDRSARHPRA